MNLHAAKGPGQVIAPPSRNILPMIHAMVDTNLRVPSELQIVFHSTLLFIRVCRFRQDAKFRPCFNPPLLSWLGPRLQCMRILHVRCLSILVVGVDNDLFINDALKFVMGFVTATKGSNSVD